MTTYNLTPHPVNIVGEDGEELVSFPKTPAQEGQFKVARVPQQVELSHFIGDVPIYNVENANHVVIDYVDSKGNVVVEAAEPFPAFDNETKYIVSFMAASKLSERTDVFSPFGLVRSAPDENGRSRILGSKGLANTPIPRRFEQTDDYFAANQGILYGQCDHSVVYQDTDGVPLVVCRVPRGSLMGKSVDLWIDANSSDTPDPLRKLGLYVTVHKGTTPTRFTVELPESGSYVDNADLVALLDWLDYYEGQLDQMGQLYPRGYAKTFAREDEQVQRVKLIAGAD